MSTQNTITTKFEVNQTYLGDISITIEKRTAKSIWIDGKRKAVKISDDNVEYITFGTGRKQKFVFATDIKEQTEEEVQEQTEEETQETTEPTEVAEQAESYKETPNTEKEPTEVADTLEEICKRATAPLTDDTIETAVIEQSKFFNEITAQKGTKAVYTTNQNTAGLYHSIVGWLDKDGNFNVGYNHADHKKLSSAKKWAAKMVN